MLHATFLRHRYTAHIHDSWVIACVDRGAASFELAGTRHTPPSGSVFVIPPGIVHTGEPATDGGYTYRVLYIDWVAVDQDAAVWSNEPWPWSSPITHDRDRLRSLHQLHDVLALPGRALEQGEALAALRSALCGVAGLHPRYVGASVSASTGRGNSNPHCLAG